MPMRELNHQDHQDHQDTQPNRKGARARDARNNWRFAPNKCPSSTQSILVILVPFVVQFSFYLTCRNFGRLVLDL
mgnify:CR=1 FL=1